MRLISTSDLKLHSFPDNAIPKYTILSHTWGKEGDEVLYHEMLKPSREVRKRSGYKKIAKCAEISRGMNVEYTWVDTCCIDKTSSAELSESINSMFAWYERSTCCLVYLEDFHGRGFREVTKENRWFTRGWTLQELLAPRNVEFYSASWERMGDKLANPSQLSSLTRISSRQLVSAQLDDTSVAEKMRWLARRTTTKVEDMAYCMLGIFDINMPLIYGEGDRAFKRLQQEIMRNSDDISILLWTEPTKSPFGFRGTLASSPEEFLGLSGPKRPMCTLDEPFSMTQKGLQLRAQLVRIDQLKSLVGQSVYIEREDNNHSILPSLYGIVLKDTIEVNASSRITTIYIILLRKLFADKNHYVRAYPGHILSMKHPNSSNVFDGRLKNIEPKSFLVLDRVPLANWDIRLPCVGFKIQTSFGAPFPKDQLEILVPPAHDPEKPCILEAAYVAKSSHAYLVLQYDEERNLVHCNAFQEECVEDKDIGIKGLLSLWEKAQAKTSETLNPSGRKTGELVFGTFRVELTHLSRSHSPEGILLVLELVPRSSWTLLQDQLRRMEDS